MIDLSCKNENMRFGVYTTYPPFSDQALHVHDECELFYLIKGDGYYETEGSRYEFKPGMILLMRPGESHRAVQLNSSPYTRLSIHFQPSVVDSLDKDRHILRIFFNRLMGTRNYYDQEMLAKTNVYEYLKKIATPCDDPYSQSLYVLSYLLPLLMELGEIFDQNATPSTDQSTLMIHDILDYINQNLSALLSIDAICDKFFITRTQLYRIFKKATKMNVWEYVVLKRLVLANSFINDGISPSEAAKMCGFKDYSTFYRAYTAKYGAPPSGVCRRHKK